MQAKTVTRDLSDSLNRTTDWFEWR